MRSEHEISSALRDLNAVKHSLIVSDGSAQLAAMVRDTLNWVLGYPSIMEESVPKLRGILEAKEKAATN